MPGSVLCVTYTVSVSLCFINEETDPQRDDVTWAEVAPLVSGRAGIQTQFDQLKSLLQVFPGHCKQFQLPAGYQDVWSELPVFVA